MAVRLQELHPALVHFPIAALPTTVGIDLAGFVTRSRSLERLGRWTMVAAAAGAALAATAGLIAQEEVNVDGPALDTLITHRNLNAALLVLTSVLAARRLRNRKVTLGQLALSALGVAGLAYSASLGGKLVYEYGAGVEPANGLRPGGVPELTRDNATLVRRTATRDLEQGVKHMVSEVARGQLAPLLLHHSRASGNGRGTSAGSRAAD
jgi:uncharacterized membrane protein